MRALRLLVAAWVGAIGLPPYSFAELIFDGSEFQINTYTTGPQSGPGARSVARSANGNFVVVWQSYDEDSYLDIRAQRYYRAGAVAGSEFQVNTFTTSNQRDPAVSAAADGSFVVVWQSFSADGSGFGIQGQRYDSTGAAAGTEFRVNTYTTSIQFHPAIAAAADGSFIVVWNSFQNDAPGVYCQRYNSTGGAAGTEFQVNTHTAYTQYGAAVFAAPDSSFVVVWDGVGQDGDSLSVQGQRYDSAGAAAGSEFQVNTYTTSAQRRPAVSGAADGSFVVVWDSFGQVGLDTSVHGQRYTSAGVAAGSEFQVNTYTSSGPRRPAVSVAADGGFVVVWDSYGQDGGGSGVQGQRYDSAGVAIGTEFQVNTYTTGFQGYSTSIAADAAGDFVVVWESSEQDGNSEGMFGQRLCQDTDSNSVCDSDVPAECSPSPAAGCLSGAKASFQLKKSDDDARDQIKWKLSRGGAFNQAALGDPATSRIYLLCIYDSTGNADSLVATLEIDPNANWTTKDPRGLQYKDKAGAEDGVTKAKLKTGDTGKTSLSIGAKGINIPMPAPAGDTAFFNQDTTVTVQLVNDQTPTCWTSAFMTAKTNDGTHFKATVP